MFRNIGRFCIVFSVQNRISICRKMVKNAPRTFHVFKVCVVIRQPCMAMKESLSFHTHTHTPFNHAYFRLWHRVSPPLHDLPQQRQRSWPKTRDSSYRLDSAHVLLIPNLMLNQKHTAFTASHFVSRSIINGHPSNNPTRPSTPTTLSCYLFDRS